MNTSKNIFILIAVCTKGENRNLPDLANSLLEIAREKKGQIRILFAINKAKQTKPRWAKPGIKVIWEPNMGYSNIRNAALSQRRPNESIIFVDDDERIENRWLDSLINAVQDFPKSVLIGPVVSITMDGKTTDSPFARKAEDFAYGQIMHFGSAGNMLIPADILDNLDLRFNKEFNGGGEDTAIVHYLSRRGIPTRWVPDAILSEYTPAARLTSEWVTQRRISAESIQTRAGMENLTLPWAANRIFLLIGSLIYNLITAFMPKNRTRLRGAYAGIRAFLRK